MPTDPSGPGAALEYSGNLQDENIIYFSRQLQLFKTCTCIFPMLMSFKTLNVQINVSQEMTDS